MAYNLFVDLTPSTLPHHSHSRINSIFCLEVLKSLYIHNLWFHLLATSFLWVSSIVPQIVVQYLPWTRTAFAGFYGRPPILCLTRIGLVPKSVLKVPKTELPKTLFNKCLSCSVNVLHQHKVETKLKQRNICRIVVIKFAKSGKTKWGDFSVGRGLLGFPHPALPFHFSFIILFTILCLMDDSVTVSNIKICWIVISKACIIFILISKSGWVTILYGMKKIGLRQLLWER